MLFSHPVVSDSLQRHGLQHTRPPCPSPSQSLPKFMSILSVMPSIHLILWSPLLLCPQSLPASGTFPVNQLFASGDQNTGASALASVLPMSTQGSFPLRLTGLISLLSKGLSEVFSSITVQKALVFWSSAFFTVQLSQLYMTTGKTIALTIWTFVSRVVSLPFDTFSRFVIAFLPRSKRLLISWLQSPSTVILEPKKKKSVTIPTFYPSVCHEVMGPNAMILVFLICSFKLAFSLSAFILIKRFFGSSWWTITINYTQII